MTRIHARSILWVMLAGILGGCGGPMIRLLDPTQPLRPRPTHYGLTLPVPISSKPWLTDSTSTGQAERRVPINLRVNQKGVVISVTFASSADSIGLACFVPYLRSLKFEPGLRDNVPAEMTLRLEMQTDGACRQPLLHFPVGPNRQIARSELYWAAFAANGIEPARLVTFPSYYYMSDPLTSGSRYDYKLYRIDLDTLGKVTAVDVVAATETKFSDQIRSATVWGEYQPLRINGRPMASINYLAVALFADMEYPTTTWSPETISSRSAEERLRIRLLPDTVGEMIPPVVRRDWSGVIADSAAWEPVRNLVSAQLQIDTTGATVIDRINNLSWRVRRVFGGLAFDRRFFPARSFSGQWLTWQGLAYARYQDASHVKIWFDWSPQTDPGPVSDTLTSN